MSVPQRELFASLTLPPSLSPELRAELAEHATPLNVPAGTTLFHPGDAMNDFLLVGGGTIRVFKGSEDGREITLYTVGSSECCTINILCLLSGRPSPASAYVEEDLRALAYPRVRFLDWFLAHASMRELVLGQMADRVHTMMALVEQVAFQRLDRRLAAHLLAATADAPDAPLAVTHEALAMELGSVREVISRILKNLESARLVELGRGRIAVRDRRGLADYGA